MSVLAFEEALERLEDRVRKLEAGDIDLEKALTLFEEGVELARTCHDQLEAAEQRVQSLTSGAKGIEESPLPDVT